MTRHPADGVLRRLVDEPAGVADPDRVHLTGCPACLTRLAEVRADAAAAAAALTTDDGGVDVDAAWRRLATAHPAETLAPARTARRGGLLRRGGVRRPLVAGVAVAAVLAGAGVAAANDWLPVFATEQVAPLSITTADLVALPDLGAYGELEVTGDGDLHGAADPAAAAAESGLDVPTVRELPAGVSGDPAVQVGGQVSAVFTYSVERAAQAAEAAGETLPAPPPGLDGSQVRLVAGPGVAQVWSSSSGIPALVVATAVAPTAYSSGVPFETLRDHLLSLPGLPDDIAAQLRTFTADGSTLPLPVPADLVESSTADVDGVPATVLASRDGSMAAVVWVRDGIVTAVAGSLDTDEVLAVARGLR